MIISETIQGKLSTTQFRWLVSCKNFAKSGKSVNENSDEQNILERCKSICADGFIGFLFMIDYGVFIAVGGDLYVDGTDLTPVAGFVGAAANGFMGFFEYDRLWRFYCSLWICPVTSFWPYWVK